MNSVKSCKEQLFLEILQTSHNQSPISLLFLENFFRWLNFETTLT